MILRDGVGTVPYEVMWSLRDDERHRPIRDYRKPIAAEASITRLPAQTALLLIPFAEVSTGHPRPRPTRIYLILCGFAAVYSLFAISNSSALSEMPSFSKICVVWVFTVFSEIHIFSAMILRFSFSNM